jgi:uncharacterized membrane protein YcjF (UPF0283 family)
LKKKFAYDKSVPAGFLLVFLGFAVALPFVFHWVRHGYRSENMSPVFITGLGIVLLGFHLFVKSLVISVTSLKRISQWTHLSAQKLRSL